LAIESDAGGFYTKDILIKGTKKSYKLSSWASIFQPYGIQSLKESSGGSDIENLAKLGTTLVGYAQIANVILFINAATDVFNVSKRWI
jgi:hypothetical protein